MLMVIRELLRAVVVNARAAPRFCRATFETGVLNALAAPVNQAFLGWRSDLDEMQ